MKIVIACDKYKGNMSAMEVCSTIKQAIMDVDNKSDVVISPMADGGEGTTDMLVESLNGNFIDIKVKGPLGNMIDSRFGLIPGNAAVVEMASASGLWLVPVEKRNPMKTTTYGTGQLIKKALDMGCIKIIIGIGGSATNDAGMGMAQALGVRFFDSAGSLLGLGGSEMIKIDKIDISLIHPAVKQCSFYVACDVKNPLFGPEGAAFVYAPQKGADAGMVAELDRGLMHFAAMVKKSISRDVAYIPGAGAAGGLGAGLVAFLGARLKPGTEIMIEATSLEKKIRGSDLVITGEGAMDNQTFYGKSSYGVAITARKYGVAVITINGSVNISYDHIEKEKRDLFDGNFATVNRDMSLDEAIKNGKKLLYAASKELFRFYKAAHEREKSSF